jgi:hypothetical protein
MTNRSMPWAAIAREFTGTVKNAAQAAKMAGLDFDVPLVECGYRSPVTNRWVVTPSRRAVVRVEGKDETFYEYVSDDYTTLPYGTAFAPATTKAGAWSARCCCAIPIGASR